MTKPARPAGDGATALAPADFQQWFPAVGLLDLFVFQTPIDGDRQYLVSGALLSQMRHPLQAVLLVADELTAWRQAWLEDHAKAIEADPEYELHGWWVQPCEEPECEWTATVSLTGSRRLLCFHHLRAWHDAAGRPRHPGTDACDAHAH